MTKLQQLAEALAHFEGFYLTAEQAATQHTSFPSIPQRLNNPGDLMFAGQHEATADAIVGSDGKTRRYARFPTVESGWAALRSQITLDASRGLTLWHFIQKYAPAADANDPKGYFTYVAGKLGAHPNDLLKDVIA